MNSQYDYIIKNIRFSFSSVSSFDTCAYGWKLLKIDAEDSVQNFFAQYGLAIHSVMEEYWKYEIEIQDMRQRFIDLYPEIVTEPPPPYPRGMEDNYYKDALTFFDSYDILRDKFEPLFIEDKIDAEYKGIKLVVKPDLVIRNRKSGKTYLLDYKSSRPLKNKDWDMEKMAGYEKQLLLYCYFLEKHMNINIDEIALLFTRLGKTYYIEKTEEKTKEVLDWFTNTVEQIRNEEDFEPNTSSKYFCSNICSVRNSCDAWR